MVEISHKRAHIQIALNIGSDFSADRSHDSVHERNSTSLNHHCCADSFACRKCNSSDEKPYIFVSLSSPSYHLYGSAHDHPARVHVRYAAREYFRSAHDQCVPVDNHRNHWVLLYSKTLLSPQLEYITKLWLNKYIYIYQFNSQFQLFLHDWTQFVPSEDFRPLHLFL